MKNKCAAVSSTTWEELEQEIYTPEEIVESDRRVAEMSRAIRMAAWRAKHGSSATQEMPYVQATEPKPRVEEPFVCKYCQKEVRGHMMVMPTEGGVVRFYVCPVCHRQTYFAIKK